MAKRTALVAGGTGLVGKELLRFLMESEEYEQVIALVRRPLEAEHPKLTAMAVDFGRLLELELPHVDDVFCCLGTTIKTAGSREAFRKVDYEYPVQLAELAERIGAGQYLIISSMGADHRSNIFYSRVKGEVERRIMQSRISQVHIFRPSLLLGERPEFRLGERIGALAAKGLNPLMIGPLRKYRAISGRQVAYGMYQAAVRGPKQRQRIAIYESDVIAKFE